MVLRERWMGHSRCHRLSSVLRGRRTPEFQTPLRKGVFPTTVGVVAAFRVPGWCYCRFAVVVITLMGYSLKSALLVRSLKVALIYSPKKCNFFQAVSSTTFRELLFSKSCTFGPLSKSCTYFFQKKIQLFSSIFKYNFLRTVIL